MRKSLPPSVLTSLGIGIAACAAVHAYADVLVTWFVGVDVFPLILSNRIASLGSVPELLTREYLSAYRESAIAGSTGIRPMGSVLFALDHAIWGLDPFGYHLTDLTIHAVNAALVFVLARALGFRRWFLAGVLASLLFARHPLQSSAVPLVSARFDLLSCTFSLVFLGAVVRHLRTGELRTLVLSAVALLFALGSKETAVVLWPALLVGVLPWLLRSSGRGRVLAFRSLLTLTPVVLLFWVYRWTVVGGLGGYPLQGRAGIAAPLLMARSFLREVVLPVPLPVDGLAAKIGASVVAVLIVIGLAAIATAVLPGLAGDENGTGNSRGSWSRRRRSEAVYLLSTWCLIYILFYSITFGLTGIFKSLYYYTLSALWSLLLAGAAVILLDRILGTAKHMWRDRRIPWVRATGLTLVVCLVVATFVGAGRSSQLDRWEAGGEIAREYLRALRAALRRIPRGATVLVANLPHGVTCTDGPCYGSVYVFEEYSLDSWRRLTLRDQPYEFAALSTVWLDPDARADVRSRASFDEDHGVLELRTTGARVEAPWNSGAAAIVDFELRSSPGGGRLMIQRPLSGTLDAGLFVFDFYGHREIIPLGRATP